MFKVYFMKPECSAIKEKVFCILFVISSFTANWKKKKGEHPLTMLIP